VKRPQYSASRMRNGERLVAAAVGIYDRETNLSAEELKQYCKTRIALIIRCPATSSS